MASEKQQQEIRDLIESLERIAYPDNWWKGIDTANSPGQFDLKAWMQSVAANALTNQTRFIREFLD